MSNNNESSVEWLISQLQRSKDWHRVLNEISQMSSARVDIIEQAKAMHKDEIEKAFYQGADDESNEHGIMYLDMNEAETYYTKTFGGNNEQ